MINVCVLSRICSPVGVMDLILCYSEDDGSLGGLSVDIYRAVCAEAGMRCKHVVTPIRYCWDGQQGIGEGKLLTVNRFFNHSD